ncbi:MAG TPA: DUF192 domain-containing protein [Ignavibacteria bacterium]|nr:DUF192 domain-containing protein [Ignavibacteria bacterium]
MTAKQEPKKPNYILYVLIAVVVAVAVYFIYTMMADNTKPEYKVKTEKKEVTEPQFKKQGELEFISGKDKKTLKKIDIEIADNDAKREQGLMYRKTMDESNGMLFVFAVSELHSFWMKNTVISLDIIFVNESKEIVKIHRNTTPFSEKSLPSEKKSMYVVETVAGFCDKYGVKDGDKIDFKITNY